MTNRLSGGLVSTVIKGGEAVVVTPTGNHGGGLIINPVSPVDQGVTVPEPLLVGIVTENNNVVDGDTSALLPGQAFLVPPGAAAWVNAATAGHSFTAYFIVPPSPPTLPDPVPGAPGFGADPRQVFPPFMPTGMLSAINAYLYKQYEDDDDLQVFFEALNEAQQNYVDTFNALSLPIYTNPMVAGDLLDWVGRGVYGYPRPALSSGRSNLIGALNTYTPNGWGFFPVQTGTVPIPQPSPPPPPPAWMGMVGGPVLNGLSLIGPNDIVVADDDTYKRCLTWHYQKGDGKYFDVRWLKRRVMRFCYGVNGTSPEIDQTNQISVTFGPDFNANIRFVLGQRTVVGGCLPNRVGPGGFGPPDAAGSPVVDIQLNSLRSTYVAYPSVPYMAIFKEALESGVLETPFQLNVTCSIG
jgi:hypothetical protein